MATPIKFGKEFLINTLTGEGQILPSIQALVNGTFVAAWNDLSGSADDPENGSIRAQIFAADGTHIGLEFKVNVITQFRQSNPSIAALANGNFVVTWEDFSGIGADASQLSVRAQIFTPTGGFVGQEFVVNTTTAISQYQPTITGLKGWRLCCGF